MIIEKITKMVERKFCLICNSSNLELFNTMPHMPVYMGNLPDIQEYKFMKMDFVECLECGNVQIKSHPSIEELYLKNHNVDMVGDLWNSHYEEFKKTFTKKKYIKSTK